MDTSTIGLSIENAWLDDDMLELVLKISNGRFAGQAIFYAALNAPLEFAQHIAGFPTSIADVREYEFGDTNVSDDGGAKIRLSCKDRTGHIVVQASVYMPRRGSVKGIESANIQFETTPSDIDSFVGEIRRWQGGVGEIAVLPLAK